MINLFRKIRQKLFKTNKFLSYLLYAIGEIVLVMIGILLAVQVNNWNEKRHQKDLVSNTLRTISYDLAIDTLSASRIIKFYEENNKNSLKIINKEITLNNYKECLPCMSLVTIYQPLNIQTKGYERLKTITDYTTSEKDSLIVDITQVYSQFSPLIEKNNERMENEILKNFNDFKSYNWFVDLSQGKFNKDMLDYFVLSEDYRKRVASHNVLAAGNHLSITKQYMLNAISLLERIDKRLETLEK